MIQVHSRFTSLRFLTEYELPEYRDTFSSFFKYIYQFFLRRVIIMYVTVGNVKILFLYTQPLTL